MTSRSVGRLFGLAHGLGGDVEVSHIGVGGCGASVTAFCGFLRYPFRGEDAWLWHLKICGEGLVEKVGCRKISCRTFFFLPGGLGEN